MEATEPKFVRLLPACRVIVRFSVGGSASFPEKGWLCEPEIEPREH